MSAIRSLLGAHIAILPVLTRNGSRAADFCRAAAASGLGFVGALFLNRHRFLAVVCVSFALLLTEARAQLPGVPTNFCPPPARFVEQGGGGQSGSLMCVCPDGTPFRLGGSCGGSGSQQQSRPQSQLPPGSVRCANGGYCAAGLKCATGGGCLPQDAVDCGNGKACVAGAKCSVGGGCVPQNSVDCGNGRSCNPGQRCTSNGGCVSENAVPCGDQYCNPGLICAAGNRCISQAEPKTPPGGVPTFIEDVRRWVGGMFSGTPSIVGTWQNSEVGRTILFKDDGFFDFSGSSILTLGGEWQIVSPGRVRIHMVGIGVPPAETCDYSITANSLRFSGCSMPRMWTRVAQQSTTNPVLLIVICGAVVLGIAVLVARRKRTQATSKKGVGTMQISEGLAKGIAISAMILAIIAIFVPIYGLYISFIALLLAVIAALTGDRVFATITPIVVAINLYFLSPSVWFVCHEVTNCGSMVAVILAALAAPFGAMAIHNAGLFAIKRV
jgi:hypothetical protein